MDEARALSALELELGGGAIVAGLLLVLVVTLFHQRLQTRRATRRTLDAIEATRRVIFTMAGRLDDERSQKLAALERRVRALEERRP